MRSKFVGALIVAAVAAASPVTAQGILVDTDTKPQIGDLRTCMMAARKAISGTGLVMQVSGAMMYGSNEDHTILIRCDGASTVVFFDAFFPGDKTQLDPIMAVFEARTAAPLVPSETKSHQYSVDCSRQTSCEIDPVAICKQAYATSAKPAAKALKTTPCADAQGEYTCAVDYDLNCS